MASAPPPRPGTALGSGKTQKTGSARANNSAAAAAAASLRAARPSGAAGPRGGPAPPGRAEAAGASPHAAGAPGRFPRGSSTGTPSSAHTAAQARRRNGEKRQDLLGGRGAAGLGRCLAPRARAEGAGAAASRPHFARTGDSPRRRPRAALRAVTAPSDAGTRLAASWGPGVSAPASRGCARPHRPHPVTSAALHSFLFDTSTGSSAVSVLPPPRPTCSCRSLRSELPLPPAPPPPPGNPALSERRPGPGDAWWPSDLSVLTHAPPALEYTEPLTLILLMRWFRGSCYCM